MVERTEIDDAIDKAVSMALMQVKIEERRRLNEDQILLNSRLAEVNKSIDEYGRALYGDDYDPKNVG